MKKEDRVKRMKLEWCYCFICQRRSGSWYYDCSLKKYGEDMVTESQFTHINLENINPGSIIERLNGNNLKLMPLWRNW